MNLEQTVTSLAIWGAVFLHLLTFLTERPDSRLRDTLSRFVNAYLPLGFRSIYSINVYAKRSWRLLTGAILAIKFSPVEVT